MTVFHAFKDSTCVWNKPSILSQTQCYKAKKSINMCLRCTCDFIFMFFFETQCFLGIVYVLKFKQIEEGYKVCFPFYYEMYKKHEAKKKWRLQYQYNDAHRDTSLLLILEKKLSCNEFSRHPLFFFGFCSTIVVFL